MNIYEKRGRPVENNLTSAGLNEIRKFFDSYKSLREAATLLGVSNTTAWAWYHGKFKPRDKFVDEMVRLSGGDISKHTINNVPCVLRRYESLIEFIKNQHLKKKSRIIGITVDEFYNDFIHPKVKRIIERGYMNEIDVPLFHAVFDNTLEYWVNVARKFHSEN